jgi:putative membrane protein
LGTGGRREESIMMDWGDSGGWVWWWMVPMMMFMIVVIGAAMWAFVVIARSNATPGRPTRSAEDILNERFARGDIDAAEYHDRIDALHGQRPTPNR